MSEQKEKRQTIRYDHNPFLSDMVLNTKSKQVRVSALGKDDNVLVNQSTGEVQGTNVVTYKQVDDAEFIKLFSANISLTFDLNKAGHKTLNLLIWSVQKTAISNDIVTLDKYTWQDFHKEHELKAFSLAVFKKGLNELEDSQIIAKAQRAGDYYINPNFIFNGDRIAFTKVIEKKSAATKRIEQEKQLTLGGLEDGA